MDPCAIYADRYNQCVLDVANKYISHLDRDELLNMKQQFKTWKKEPDKLNVNNLYTLSGWRALYTQNLFMSRISTMLLTFRQVLVQPHVFEILKCVKRVVSIGCGPGPDIAAVLMLLRTSIGVNHFVKVIGIDQFIGWRQYVVSLNKVDLDGMTCSVEFWQLRVEEKTLDDVLAAEMCVMSYTDAAVHTQKFWQGLKLKFSLIVILDQKKGSLTRLLRGENFRMVEYEYKGTKRFFYWVDPHGVKDSLSYISTRFSRSESTKTEMTSTVPPVTPPVPADEEDDDDEDDNSEQQRELAAIFDRLGNIGKMPVAQLNELDEVQKIRDELSRTYDNMKDGATFDAVVKPKRSYRSALEPQKHLSKERKNQLLKAKLRELGVESEEDNDDEDDSDVEEISFQEDSGSFVDLTHEEMSPLKIDTRELEQKRSVSSNTLDNEMPIICLGSGSGSPMGNAIPTVDHVVPNYSPPIVIPPINMQSDQTKKFYPVGRQISKIPTTYSGYPSSNPETPISITQPLHFDSHILPVAASSIPRGRYDSFTYNSVHQSVINRTSSLVVLSDYSEEPTQIRPIDSGYNSKSSKRPSSCLGPVENITYCDDRTVSQTAKHVKYASSNQTNMAHFNSAAEAKKKNVTDLRQLLNSRRQKRSSNP